MSTTFANMAVAGIIVFSTVSAGRMTYLCALRWRHLWRLFASLPLMALAAWLGLTAIQYRQLTGLPPLWSVELYAWAMTSAVYLGGSHLTGRDGTGRCFTAGDPLGTIYTRDLERVYRVTADGNVAVFAEGASLRASSKTGPGSHNCPALSCEQDISAPWSDTENAVVFLAGGAGGFIDSEDGAIFAQ